MGEAILPPRRKFNARYFDTRPSPEFCQQLCKETRSKNECTVDWIAGSFWTGYVSCRQPIAVARTIILRCIMAIRKLSESCRARHEGDNIWRPSVVGCSALHFA